MKAPHFIVSELLLLRQRQRPFTLKFPLLPARPCLGCPPPTDTVYAPSATMGSPASVTMLMSRGFSSNRTFCEAPGLQMNALEAPQRLERRTRNVGESQIKLRHFIARFAAGIGHGNFGNQRASRLH